MTTFLEITFDLSKVNEQAWVIAFVGYLIVFIALVVLFFVFNSLPKLLGIKLKKIVKRKTNEAEDAESADPLDLSGEVNAAIAMALHLQLNEVHDEESNIVTIKRISRAYSPWSSKIYAVRNQFNRI